MDFPFVEQNTASRHRLQLLAARPSDEDLALSTPYGGTVAALFAHLAWWDQRVPVLLRHWKEKGLNDSPVDAQAINDALRPLCHATPPRAAVQLCLSSARETDAEIETLPPDLVAQIQASPNHFRLNRALHRNDHLKDIETLLRQPEASAHD